jgi:hypothetical protein
MGGAHRVMHRWFMVIGTVLAAAFATVTLRFLPAVNIDRAALADEAVALGAAPPRLAHRVVLVIADGLRLDTSRGLPFLDRLRARGVDGAAVAPWPTLSRPNQVSILAGVEPRWSGVRNNQWSGQLGLDSLPARVEAAGMRVGFAADQRSEIRLFERTWERELPRSVAARSEELLVIVPSAIDGAGHRGGGASEDYLEAARAVDRELVSMLDLDLSRDAIVIVADHGHTERGGHGGIELEVTQVPLVLAGAGTRAGAVVRGASLTDVAPTIAALLGIPAPVHATGRTLVEALAVSDRDDRPGSPVPTPDAGVPGSERRTPATSDARELGSEPRGRLGGSTPDARELGSERRDRIGGALSTTEARELAGVDAERRARLAVALAAIEERELAAVAATRAWRIPCGALVLALVVAALVVAQRRGALVIDVRTAAASVAFPAGFCGAIAFAPSAHSPGDALSLARELAGYLAIAASAQVAAMLAAARGRPERALGIFAIGLALTAGPAIAAWAVVGEHVATTLPSPSIFMLTPIAAAAAAVHAALGTALLGAIVVRARARRDIVEAPP